MTIVTKSMRTGRRLALLAAPLLAAAGTPDPFALAFPTRGEPARLHYRVMYRTADGVHRAEVWREGDRRVKRVTDAAVALYAFHPVSSDPGYKLSVLDLKRHIHTLVDRTNLYRIGQFADWFDLGHGLRHPAAAYTIKPGVPPPHIPALPAPCRWHDLAEAGRLTRICWDPRAHLPLEIATAQGQPLWRVVALDRAAFPRDTFTIHDKGFVRNDANQDISND